MTILTISNILISITILCSCAFIGSVFIGFSLPLYTNDLQINDSLKENLETDRFLNPKTTTFLKVYLFNIDNPNEVLNGDEIPQITEIGPFVYREIRTRVIDHQNDSSDTFTMTETKTYEFDAEQSFPLTESTTVTTFNLAIKMTYDYATAYNMIMLADYCYKAMMQNNLFITLTAKETIFDGFTICNYPDDIPKIKECDTTNLNVFEDLCNSITSNNPYTKQDNNGLWKMSLLGHINDEVNTYEIKNGASSANERGNIVKVNDLSSITNWGGIDSKCNQVSSNEANIFPSTLNRNSTILMFSTDNCRNFEYEYYNESIYQYLHSMAFYMKPTTFFSSEIDPKLDCYCPSEKLDEFDDESCFLDGVLNIKPCTEIPILLSFPYYLNAAGKYKETVAFKDFNGDDFYPDENLYQSYILIEHNTRITLESAQKLQYNVITKPTKSGYLKTLKRSYLPVFWTEEKTMMSSDGVSEIISDFYFSKREKVNEGTRWGLIGTFLILTIASMTSLIVYKQLLC